MAPDFTMTTLQFATGGLQSVHISRIITVNMMHLTLLWRCTSKDLNSSVNERLQIFIFNEQKQQLDPFEIKSATQ